jgi:prostatic aicd phosphatase
VFYPECSFAVDGRTILPSIFGALQSIANNTLKLHYSAISYKPFISLVNMTADPSHPYGYQDFAGGLNEYASAMVLEVYSNNSIIMKYKNGTTDSFHVLPLNSSLNTVDGFVSSLEVKSLYQTFK